MAARPGNARADRVTAASTAARSTVGLGEADGVGLEVAAGGEAVAAVAGLGEGAGSRGAVPQPRPRRSRKRGRRRRMVGPVRPGLERASASGKIPGAGGEGALRSLVHAIGLGR